MADAKFLLEHFYYGQLVHHGKPSGEPRVLAQSPGVSSESASAAVNRVSLPPLIRSDNGAWAVVRSRERDVPFLMVQSQQGSAGQVIAHYVMLSSEALRAVGGHVRHLLDTLVQDELPTYEQIGDKLKPLEMGTPTPLATEVQVDAILELMTITRNRTNVIERLLAAIVQGVQLIVQGAPPNLAERVDFVEGLLCMLPPSVRFGVTFTTHSLPSTDINAQIRFYSDDLPPAGTSVFNWSTGQVTGQEVEDEYSRFVVGLLRLDADIVIERTAALKGTAGWRINQGDSLAGALGYAGKRARLDDALRNNQPVDKDEVSRILADDPTLDNELLELYARHLIKFSLAMDDMDHADAVLGLLRAHADLNKSVRQQFRDALAEGQAWLLFDTLVKWMSDPFGPEGREWVDLTHQAALQLLRELVEAREIDEVTALLEDMRETGPGVNIGEIVPEIVKLTLPLSANDAGLVQNLFLMAVKFLDMRGFHKVMTTQHFLEKLPLDIRRAWALITEGTAYTTPSESLVKAAAEFGEKWQGPVLLRFTEMAAAAGQFGLLETPSLRVLKDMALEPDAGQYTERLLAVVGAISDKVLANLQRPGPLYLLQIRLALGDYEAVGREMIRHAKIVYPGDMQMEYLHVSEHLFSDTPIAMEQVPRALSAINQAGVKATPFISAAIGALDRDEGSPDLDKVAGMAVDALGDNPQFMQVVPLRTVVNLFNYYTRRQDVEGAVRAASLVPLAARYQSGAGPKAMVHVYRRMDWDGRTRAAALQLLRTYIRETEDEEARRAIGNIGRELGDEVQSALQTTYLVKQLMGGDTIVVFARRLHAASEFLQDTGTVYTRRGVPKTGQLLDVLDGLPGGLNSEECKLLARSIIDLGRAIVELGGLYQSNKPRDEAKYHNQLLTGEVDPRSGLDVLRAMGGYFARGRRFETQLEQDDTPRLLSQRSSAELLDQIVSARSVLADVLVALPPDKPIKLTVAALRAEMESLWSVYGTEKQREVVRDLAIDLQRVPDLTDNIAANGDAKALEESPLGDRIDGGKHHPRSTLEMFRFIYRYYAARA